MSFKVIPAIDILDGKVVRLTQGDYNQSKIYSDDPVEVAKQFEAAGIKRIHLVDLDGARRGRPVNLEVIKNIRNAVSLEIELGGGIRSEEDADILFKVGIDLLIIGSVALNDKALTKKLIDKYGKKVIIGIDAKEGMVSTEGWLKDSQVTVADLVKEMEKLGVKTIIYTDIARDGMLTGPNIEAYSALIGKADLKVIASGGISSKHDIEELKKLDNVEGVIIGRAYYEGKIKLEEIL